MTGYVLYSVTSFKCSGFFPCSICPSFLPPSTLMTHILTLCVTCLHSCAPYRTHTHCVSFHICTVRHFLSRNTILCLHCEPSTLKMTHTLFWLSDRGLWIQKVFSFLLFTLRWASTKRNRVYKTESESHVRSSQIFKFRKIIMDDNLPSAHLKMIYFKINLLWTVENLESPTLMRTM